MTKLLLITVVLFDFSGCQNDRKFVIFLKNIQKMTNEVVKYNKSNFQPRAYSLLQGTFHQPVPLSSFCRLLRTSWNANDHHLCQWHRLHLTRCRTEYEYWQIVGSKQQIKQGWVNSTAAQKKKVNSTAMHQCPCDFFFNAFEIFLFSF